MVALLFCFAGVLILIDTKTESSDSFNAFNGMYFIGVLLALFDAASLSIVQVSTRRMKEVNFTVLQFNYTLIASSFQIMFLVGRSLVTTHSPFNGIGLLTGKYSSSEYQLMILASIINVIWMSCMTIANQLESSAFLSIFSYTAVVYTVLADLLLF